MVVYPLNGPEIYVSAPNENNHFFSEEKNGQKFHQHSTFNTNANFSIQLALPYLLLHCVVLAATGAKCAAKNNASLPFAVEPCAADC